MTPAINFAKNNKIDFQIHEYQHDPDHESYGLEAAEKLSLPVEQVFKTLVVSLDNKQMAVAVVPVSSMLNLKLMAKALETKKTTMAEKTDVEFTFPHDYDRRIIDRITYRLGVPNDPGGINERLIRLQESNRADLIFIVKGVYIRPGNGDGTFGAENFYQIVRNPVSLSILRFQDVAVGDLDGDGHVDLFVSVFNHSKILRGQW